MSQRMSQRMSPKDTPRMAFAREKRLLLGLMALLVPIPLPLNDVVLWPIFAAYMLGTALFLRRAWMDDRGWLPNWGMNLLGLAYLPFFFLDLLVLSRGRMVQPVVHLCLFALLVKLFSLTRERDKWQAVIGIFFLFLAAMGTSVHPTIVLYLVGFLVLTLALLTRFAFLHVLAGFGREDPALARIPLRSFLALTTLSVIVLSVPLFALLPRVRSPYILGRGTGMGNVMEAAGFSDEVTLDSIGQIRNSRDVVIRLQEEGALDPNREMRFKAATFDLYQAGTWRRSPSRTVLEREERARFWLAKREDPKRWVRMWLQPLRSRSVPLPVESIVVQPTVTMLTVDQGGAVSFRSDPMEIVEYRVGLVDRPVLTGSVPAGPRDPALDLASVTPRMRDLAARAMGLGTPAERADRLEQHLIQSYQYTLDFRGRTAGNPIEDFLFRYKSGQCEYFASSMVLLLRSQGIPARLVTGFLGGEYNPFEGYYIVRDSNAHAWVEAYVAGEGWRIYDPTPPAGRPLPEGEGLSLLAQQAWDYVLFRWDRYVLTFGLYDQLRIFGNLRQLWAELWQRLDRPEKARPTAEAKPEAAPAGQETSEEPLPLPDVPLPTAIGLTVAAALVYGLYLWFKPPLTATAAYRRLRQRLGRRGLAIAESVPPLVLRHEASSRYPGAAEPMARVIDFYLRESFGGYQLQDGEREELKAALGEAEKRMRKAG